MTKTLIVMLALTFALSACESEPADNNSNANAAKPGPTTQAPTPAPTVTQEASPAPRAVLKAGDKVKVAVNGASASATIVSIDEKAGRVTIRVDGEKQDKTVAIADVVKQ